jgi:hypothetical protein
MTTRLSQQIERLYRLPGAAPDAGLPLIGADGRVRTMVVSLGRPGDWTALSAVWRGVQADLALPAPAIAVNGVDAYELWFSLAEPVALTEADAFLRALARRYVPAIPPHRLQLRPALDAQPGRGTTPMIPAAQGTSGHWSAFVAPDLAAVFGDEPVLDLPPGEDAQADLLSRLSCIKPAEFANALAQLLPGDTHLERSLPSTAVSTAVLSPVGSYTGDDPRQFLLHVMKDPTVALALRIEAAKALL